MKYEYKVTWRRNGRHRAEVRFGTIEAALRRKERVETADPHWRCEPEFHRETVDGPPTCDPPIVAGPTVLRRKVGEWEVVDG